MKTRNEIIFAETSRILFAILLLAGAQVHLHAQLVADGTTAFINGTSVNLTGNLVVGTNGSFTTLIITNAGAVTNSLNGIIGQYSTAKTNRVIVTGTDSDWNIGGNLDLGYFGGYNQLIVTNGGRVENNFGNIGLNTGSVGNSAFVTGTDSVWTNRSNVNVGDTTPFNRLVISNNGTLGGNVITVGNGGASNQLTVAGGGKIFSSGGTLGNTAYAYANTAVITDPGSQWASTGGIQVGLSSSFNQLWVTNGAKISSAGAFVGASAFQSGSGNSNLLVIGGGATWTNNSTKAAVGDIGSFNQLIITNDGVLRSTFANASLTMGFQASSSNNVVAVSGANSVLSSGTAGGLSQIVVGFGGSENQLLVTGGATAQTENLYVGYNAAATSNNAVTLSGGNLFVTNASGTGVTDVRSGSLTLFPGVFQTDWLLLTNGQRSQFSFNGGTLRTRNTSVTNNSTVVVGSNSRFDLLGNGTHAFAGGLQINYNGTVAGNGTIRGKLTILYGTLAPGSDDTPPGMGKIILDTTPQLQDRIVMKISKSGTVRTNDQIEVTAPLFYGGWLIVSNIGPDTLAIGDNFKLFSGTTLSGNIGAIYLPSLPPGLTWTNKLLVDGSIEVVPWSGPEIATDFSASPYLYLDATDGFPGWPYDVLSSTNLATTNWTVVVSDYFDWNGVARIYLGNTEATPAQFFRLQTHAP